MTRKDYQIIADTLLDSEISMETHAYQWLCRRFATNLANDNPKFDIDKFLEACGVS